MLYLIGLGIGDQNDISLRGLEIAKKADKIFIELYTSAWFGDLLILKRMIGKEIKELKRSDLEENIQNIIDLAKNNDIVIFVPGDGLLATTHINLILEAKKRDIKYKILHNSSIFSFLGETGLHIYKFGKSATIPFSDNLENVKNVINQNKSINAHTLLLLDIDYEKKSFLSVGTAIKKLLDNKIIKADEKIIVCSRAGTEKQKMLFGMINSISGYFTDEDVPAIIIIPSELHFTEKEYLNSISI